jgi:hypothetical protein
VIFRAGEEFHPCVLKRTPNIGNRTGRRRTFFAFDVTHGRNGNPSSLRKIILQPI